MADENDIAYRKGFYDGYNAGARAALELPKDAPLPERIAIFVDGYLFLWSQAGVDKPPSPSLMDDPVERWIAGITSHLSP